MELVALAPHPLMGLALQEVIPQFLPQPETAVSHSQEQLQAALPASELESLEVRLESSIALRGPLQSAVQAQQRLQALTELLLQQLGLQLRQV